MPYKSRWSLPIPDCSLPTFLFKSASHEEPAEIANRKCYIEASNPDTEYLTRVAYKLWAQRLAVGITRLPNFKHGDRILLFSGTSICFPVAFMGIVMAGGIFSAANPSFTARELAHQLRDSGASYLFVMEASLETAVEAATTVGLTLDRVRLLDASVFFKDNEAAKTKNEVQSWASIFASEEQGKKYQWADLKGPDEAKETILALNYSSGTTGVPKGVMITHRNYISNCLQHQHLATLRPDHEERNERARWLCYLPMYHAMAQTIYLSGAVMRKVPVYLMPKFDFIQVLQAIEKFKITDFSMVPPIAVMVAKHPAVKKYDLSSIDTIGSGAAPLGSEASRELEKVWNGRLNLKQGWGMTEVTCSLLGWDPTKHSSSFAVGEPNANTSAKLMKITEDPTTSSQSFTEVTSRGPDHLGELWCQGPNVMKGYWKNDKATKETFSPDGQWLRTGDVAYVDDAGHFFIVDRIKELIKVKGNQVAPAELEALILDHPGISDVAVIGIQAGDGEEKPRAYCVRQQGEPGQKVTQTDITKFVEDKVIRYKRLSGGVEFVDAIPKNPSGKILRRQLREMAKKKEERSEGAKL